MTYCWWLDRLAAAVPEVSPLAVRTFFAALQHRSPSHQHQAYRALKTPTEDELRAVLAACPDTLEGIRNRVLILVLADAGLRASEALRLLIEDWRVADRGLFVRAGKGRKDRVTFVGPTTTRALKTWLSRHPVPSPESFLFTDRQGQPLKPRHLVQVLHRLSTNAGLPSHRRLHPYALRHFAATSWLRGATLRYSSLIGADLQRAHRKAGAIERLRLER